MRLGKLGKEGATAKTLLVRERDEATSPPANDGKMSGVVGEQQERTPKKA